MTANNGLKMGGGKLFFASIGTLVGLYGILLFLLIIIFELLEINLEFLIITSIIILGINFLTAPFFMDLTMNCFYKIQWRRKEEIPEYIAEFIQTICDEKNIAFPKFGIIDDNSPNAFTYGRTPNDARVVVTKGTILMLSEDELKAVIAHEMGHVVHWDMLLMTVAQLVPIITYSISKSFFRSLNRRGRKSSDKSDGIAILIAAISYVIYIVSEYVVLWFSRVREYYADQFSGQVTKNPNYLANALIKIGFGLKSANKEDSKANNTSALGICDENTMKTLGIVSYVNTNPTKQFDEQDLKDISKWDLWNPWASVYEINSTHPLIAKRLKNLSVQASAMGQEPVCQFDEVKPESYADDFIKELFIMFMPVIIFMGGAIFCITDFYSGNFFNAFIVACLLAAVASLIKTIYRYPNKNFNDKNIENLLKEVKVSSVRPIPCKLSGRLIGKGTPGYIFSEDFTLEDESGIIFLDYAQPLNLWNSLFGLLNANKYIDKEAEVIGWYRRAPVPYIEIKEMYVEGKRVKCYSYIVQIILSVILIVALGFLLLLGVN